MQVSGPMTIDRWLTVKSVSETVLLSDEYFVRNGQIDEGRKTTDQSETWNDCFTAGVHRSLFIVQSRRAC
jgi:hypothetical protein